MIPTFGVIPAFGAFSGVGKIPGGEILKVDPTKVVCFLSSIHYLVYISIYFVDFDSRPIIDIAELPT